MAESGTTRIWQAHTSASAIQPDPVRIRVAAGMCAPFTRLVMFERGLLELWRLAVIVVTPLVASAPGGAGPLSVR
jgi:hypothetical protein